jgi:REP element-mobilizing transposase RayT
MQEVIEVIDVTRLSHSKRECNYHVVWIPKYWKKIFVRGVAKGSGINIPRARHAKRESGD